MKLRRIDPALAFFGLGALACLLVSIPATSTAMDIFHGDRWGWVATGVFEVGAVGLELMSLAIPQWRGRLLLSMLGMLAITTAFNYATGIDSYITAALKSGTTYASIRASGYGWLLTIAAAALFPAMLGGFLLGFTARSRMVAAKLHTPMAAVAFWLAHYWQASGADVARLGAELAQAQSDQAQSVDELARVRQIAQELRTELARRDAAPAQLTDEQLTIGARSLGVRQLARLLEMPESTLRRRLAQDE